MDTPKKPKRPRWRRSARAAVAATTFVIALLGLIVWATSPSLKSGSRLQGHYDVQDIVKADEDGDGAVVGTFSFRYPEEAGLVTRLSGWATIRWPDGAATQAWFSYEVTARHPKALRDMPRGEVRKDRVRASVPVGARPEISDVLPAELLIDDISLAD